jgi:hypothetical protein
VMPRLRQFAQGGRPRSPVSTAAALFDHLVALAMNEGGTGRFSALAVFIGALRLKVQTKLMLQRL